MLSIFDSSKQYLKRISPFIETALKYQDKYSTMSDDELRIQTEILKQRIKNNEEMELIICDAFAVCREASKRILKKEHYNCQMQAGLAMLDNKIAEMATGEGKTLSAILPAYLKALEGNGVHIITSNDYLAERDYHEMSQIFNYLGLSTGLIQSSTQHEDRKKAYAADITYCSNTQVCFDYLRDNLVNDKSKQVLRGFGYALVDEADSILIDEAETPIIISRTQEQTTNRYFEADRLVSKL